MNPTASEGTESPEGADHADEGEVSAEEAEELVVGLDEEDLDNIIEADGELPEDDSDSEEPAATPAKAAAPEKTPAQQTEKPSQEAAKQTAPDAELEEKFNQLKKQVDGQEILIKRRTSELSQLRNQLIAQNEELSARLDDLYHESPTKAMEAKSLIDQNSAQIEAIEGEATTIQRTHVSQKLLTQHIRPGEVDVEDVISCLQEDGLDQGDIEAFKQNRFAFFSDPVTLLQMTKRARAEKVAKKFFSIAKQLFEENKKLKGGERSAIKRVAKTLKADTAVTGRSGGASKAQSTEDIDFTTASEEDINRILENSDD